MRSCQFLCIALALSACGCASWHRPSLVYRGRPDPIEHQAARHGMSEPGSTVNVIDLDVNEANAARQSDDEETLTPPIEGTNHRHKYRPPRNSTQGEVEQQLRDRLPLNPPGNGFIELPPPPDEDSVQSSSVKVRG